MEIGPLCRIDSMPALSELDKIKAKLKCILRGGPWKVFRDRRGVVSVPEWRGGALEAPVGGGREQGELLGSQVQLQTEEL